MKKKKIKLTNYERETIINYNRAEKKAIIYTTIQKDKERLAKLSQEHPNKYKLIKKDEVSVTYETEKKMVRFMKPRPELTEKQRKEIKERLLRARNTFTNN